MLSSPCPIALFYILISPYAICNRLVIKISSIWPCNFLLLPLEKGIFHELFRVHNFSNRNSKSLIIPLKLGSIQISRSSFSLALLVLINISFRSLFFENLILIVQIALDELEFIVFKLKHKVMHYLLQMLLLELQFSLHQFSMVCYFYEFICHQ